MTGAITRADARACAERWKLVEAVQQEELLAMTPAEKLEQPGELME